MWVEKYDLDDLLSRTGQNEPVNGYFSTRIFFVREI